MSSFDKKVVVTEDEWQECLNEYWKRVLNSWAECQDIESELILEKYFQTGDIKRYIEETLVHGGRPGGIWAYVLTFNPSRNIEKLKENIQIFWTWVLESPKERLPDLSDANKKIPAQKYFEKVINLLGGVNTPILDPVCSAEIFLWIYGETFKKECIFPMPLGRKGWQPTLNSDPEEMFFKGLSVMEHYLFEEKKRIKYRQALMLVDYWFSTIPELKDARIFDTILYENEIDINGIELCRKQLSVRTFLANLHDYNVWYDEVDKLPHNDPELELYIKDKLAGMNMPEEYNLLIEFIHKHKEDCLDASE